MRHLFLRLLSSFRTNRAERELAREIRAHLQLLEDDHIARGMDPEEARYAALRAFGGVEQAKEHQRDARMFRGLAGWPADLRLGARLLAKYPGLTLVGGLAMAFAIWVGLVVFQVVGLFVHPTLPLADGDRLVHILTRDVAENADEDKVLHDFLRWESSLQSLTDLGAWRDSSRNLVVAEGGEARPVAVAEMSATGFRVASGAPLLGRVLVDADAAPAAPAVAVIGHEVWRTRFDSDPGVLGRVVQLGSDEVTVVGVMAEGFEFPVSHDVWLPFKTAALDQQPRSGPAITVFARLAPEATLATAQAELTAAGRGAAAQFPDTHQHLEPLVRPYAMMAVPGDADEMPIMYSVYVVTALLLILICGNVGLLLFARAASREADLVIRTALGASRGRIVAQMFAEALVLGGVAAVAGIAAAHLTLGTWGVAFLEVNLGRLPFWFDLSLSPATFAVAAALTVACAAIAGIMPALRITRGMGPQLKQTSAGSGGPQFGGVWTAVIVAQVAATVLFPALVYQQLSLLNYVRDFDPGFATEQYLAVQIERDHPVGAGVDAGADLGARNARLTATLDELGRRLAAQPGVAGVTFMEDLPSTNHPGKVIDIGDDVARPDAGTAAPDGSPADPPFRQATVVAADPSYVAVLGAPILAGRGFTRADIGARVALVDQGFVDQVLQGRNAVGQQVRFRYPGPPERRWAPGDPDDPAGPGDWFQIVGVVGALDAGAPTTAGRAAGLYLPATPDQFDQIHMLLHVRGGDPTALAPTVHEVAMAVHPSLRLVNVQRASDANSDVLWVLRLWLRITTALSGVALVLSLAGIYAVLSFAVARRTREIGLRVALGASRSHVVTAILRRPLSQVALGVATATTIIFAVAVLIRNTEFPGSDQDLTLQGAATIVAYAVVMLGVCLLGCVAPTRRALGIEPTTALRTE